MWVMQQQLGPSSPVLFFDSGVGGLTVLAEFRKVLPQVPVIYVADYAALPYGNKTEHEIITRVPALLGRLVELYHPRLIIIACNTASTIALDTVRAALDLPVVGTVPAIKPAAETTRTGVIGLLGTAATIRQGYVDNLQARFASDKLLLRYAAPGLVEAAEVKLRGGRPDVTALNDAATGLRDQEQGEKIDTLVLACTHFSLLQEELISVFGSGTFLVDGAKGIARRTAWLIRGQKSQRIRDDLFVFTGADSDVQPLLPALASYGLTQVDPL
jgi:glutamate racemase